MRLPKFQNSQILMNRFCPELLVFFENQVIYLLKHPLIADYRPAGLVEELASVAEVLAEYGFEVVVLEQEPQWRELELRFESEHNISSR